MSYFEAPLPPAFMPRIRALTDEQLNAVHVFAEKLVIVFEKTGAESIRIEAAPAILHAYSDTRLKTISESGLHMLVNNMAAEAGIASRSAPNAMGLSRLIINPFIAKAISQRVNRDNVVHALCTAASNEIDTSTLTQAEKDELATYQARKAEYLSFAE